MSCYSRWEMKRRFFIFSLFGVLVAAACLVFEATRSPLFLVRSVEIVDHPPNAPVSKETVNSLAAITLGSESLFFLDLKKVEARILKNNWIRQVRIQKKFPGSVVVAVSFRQPKGIFQNADGSVAYVDREGTVFGEGEFSDRIDLPVFSGFKSHNSIEAKSLIKEAVEFSESWDRARVSKVSQISAISWDPDKGVRASLVYPLRGVNRSARTTLEIGNLTAVQERATWRIMDSNLEKVLRYLSNNSITAHQIFVGDGKKIVVRTAPGS